MKCAVAIAVMTLACGRDKPAPAPAPAPAPEHGPDPWAVAPADAAAPNDAVTPDPLPAGVADLAPLLEPARVRGKMPALAAAVWRDGTLLAEGVTGVRGITDPHGVAHIDDRWHLGSDTKAMTAMLVAIHLERGQLHLDDTVATLFKGESIDPSWAKVTLHQLLDHRGGAPGTLSPDLDHTLREGDRAAFVRALLAKPVAQAPGTFVYANASYILIGAALERITKHTWEDLMRTELFAPLKMASCGFGPPAEGPRGHVADSHGTLTPMAPTDPDADNPPALGPAGTVHCSLADWHSFLEQQLAPTLVKPATLARLDDPLPGDGQKYAAGWIIAPNPWGTGTALSHDGSNTMWYASAWIVPATHMIVVAASNRGGLEHEIYGVINWIVARHVK